MKILKFTALATAFVGAIFLLPQAVRAASVSVGNASFESDGTGEFTYPGAGSLEAGATTGDGNYYEEYDASASNDTSILGPDWSLTSTAGGWNLIDVTPGSSTYNNRFTSAGTSAGPTYAFMNIDSGTGADTITSTFTGLNLAIQANTVYTLTIAVGNPSSTEGAAGFGDPAPDEFIQFLANGNALDGMLFPDATVSVADAPNGTFTDYTATFTTGTMDTAGIFGDALAIQMGGVSTDDASTYGVGAFDNVRLDVSAVPEPSTWALMLGGAGLLVVAAARRVRA